MKRLLLSTLAFILLTVNLAIAQTAPTGPLQLTTNSRWTEPSTGLRWDYNGTTYGWWADLGVKDSTRYVTPYYLSHNYIQNGTGLQTGANYTIDGIGTAGYFKSTGNIGSAPTPASGQVIFGSDFGNRFSFKGQNGFQVSFLSVGLTGPRLYSMPDIGGQVYVGSGVVGSLVYGNGSSTGTLPIGSTGDILAVAPSGVPDWVSGSGSYIQNKYGLNTVQSNAKINITDSIRTRTIVSGKELEIVVADTTAGGVILRPVWSLKSAKYPTNTVNKLGLFMGTYRNGSFTDDAIKVYFKTGGGLVASSGSQNDSPGLATMDWDYSYDVGGTYYFSAKHGVASFGYLDTAATHSSYDFQTLGTPIINYDKLGNVSMPRLSITGTGGLGDVALNPQTSTPTTPASGIVIYASNTANRFGFLGSNGFPVNLSSQLITAARTPAVADNGGTLVTMPSPVLGGIPYALSISTFANLPIGSAGQVFTPIAGAPAWSNIKTINSASLIGSGNIALQTPLVAGTDYLTPTGNGSGLTNVNSTLWASNPFLIGGALTTGDTFTFDGTNWRNGSVSVTGPLQKSGPGVTGAWSITKADATHDGYVSLIDWNTFNGKQSAINGIGFVKVIGTTISYDNSTYLQTSGFTTSAINALYSYTPANGANYLGLHATADNSVNSAQWGGVAYNASGPTGILYTYVYDATGQARIANSSQMQTWLSLGSYAYRSSGLAELSGAVFTGVVSASNLSNTNTGDQTTSSANSDISVATGGSNPVLTFNRVLANGVTATTQSAGDNSTKVATTAYADTKASYSEGTWTPSGADITANYGTYIKIGNQVTCYFDIFVDINSDPLAFHIETLPFTCSATSYGSVIVSSLTGGTLTDLKGIVITTTDYCLFRTSNTGGVNVTRAQLSNSRIVGTITYRTN